MVRRHPKTHIKHACSEGFCADPSRTVKHAGSLRAALARQVDILGAECEDHTLAIPLHNRVDPDMAARLQHALLTVVSEQAQVGPQPPCFHRPFGRMDDGMPYGTAEQERNVARGMP